ncbi:hypothetical protein DVR12_27460 [Chitinophaga silvatica]|uniref:Uncharacterized protein n=1 Tax=Chitinophaga silvatica TaxID=2282649 RepID=A0A3E1Y1Y1_9BACT|nr:hypothetical protein [Chitinophaga silvatica]RFS18653.1 hypothetical protein DVR12_27460 [Chitinophaga silvatica]
MRKIIVSLLLLCSCKGYFFVPIDRVVVNKPGYLMFYVRQNQEAIDTLDYESRYLLKLADTNKITSVFWERKISESFNFLREIKVEKPIFYEFGNFKDREWYLSYCDTLGYDKNGIYMYLPVVMVYVPPKHFYEQKKIKRQINDDIFWFEVRKFSASVIRVDPVTKKVFEN